MSNLLPREKIGSGMGLYGTMNALGMAIAPAIGVSVYQSLGYRAAFLIAAAFGVLTVLIIQFVGDKGEPAAAPAASGRERLQLIEPKVIPVALVIMLFAIPYCATQSFLVSYVEARGVNVSVSLFSRFMRRCCSCCVCRSGSGLTVCRLAYSCARARPAQPSASYCWPDCAPTCTWCWLPRLWQAAMGLCARSASPRPFCWPGLASEAWPTAPIMWGWILA